jgi:hypothetical protein
MEIYSNILGVNRIGASEFRFRVRVPAPGSVQEEYWEEVY